MNQKPRVVYLGEHLPSARIVLPITDPYVAHHGALGGCAFVHTRAVDEALDRLRTMPGVCEALPRAEAAARHALPADRIGDIVVFGDAETAFGKTRDAHDLSQLRGPLRSHGGPAEADVPILFSVRPPVVPTRSRDLFGAALALAR
jgi:phosphonoacetate hydrolase